MAEEWTQIRIKRDVLEKLSRLAVAEVRNETNMNEALIVREYSRVFGGTVSTETVAIDQPVAAVFPMSESAAIKAAELGE